MQNTARMRAPATAATEPLIQNVKSAEANPNRTLKGRKHHMRLEPLLRLSRFVIKSYTRRIPGLTTSAACPGAFCRGGGDGIKSATAKVETKQATVYLSIRISVA